MIQISMKQVSELLAQSGIDLSDHPELAAQVMVANEQLSALSLSGVDPDMVSDMLAMIMSAESDAPEEASP